MAIYMNKLFVPDMVQDIGGNLEGYDFRIDSLGDINIFVGENSSTLSDILQNFQDIPVSTTIELAGSRNHKSSVPKVIGELIRCAKGLSQVFITTQSLDVVYHVMDTYGNLTVEPDLDIKFIWVGQSGKVSDNKKLISVIFGRDEFETCLRMGIDVRGGSLPTLGGDR